MLTFKSLWPKYLYFKLALPYLPSFYFHSWFYNLPGGAAAGIADSKLPDMQAGWEQATSNVMAGLSGLNLVYEAVGMHASLLGFCLESMILGDDLLGQALRCVKGINVDEESLSIETMKSVCLQGPGHYLGHAQTLGLMQTEYIYPNLGDRSSPKEWAENHKPNLLIKAKEKKKGAGGRILFRKWRERLHHF